MRAVASGDALYGGNLARRIVAFYAGNEVETRTERGFPDLTPREREVLELLTVGCRKHRSPDGWACRRRRYETTCPRC